MLKPTEYICLDAIRIAQIIAEETEIPPGVFNLLLGGKGDVGEILCSHPAVDQVTFTGSTVTGRRVMARRLGDGQAGHSGARWQVGEHHLRRR